ncbi:MAG TPA: MBL fold metallo-hydrolase [Candidatus Binataceae bacterium]
MRGSRTGGLVVIAVLVLIVVTGLILALAIVSSTPYPAEMEANGTSPGGRIDPASWPNGALTIANLGHATVLMNFRGVRLISDPSLFSRVGLAIDSIATIGPRRVTAPPLSPAELQALDLILITHAHMDHLDLPSLRALPKNVVVVACEGCSRLIAPLGYADVRELKWGEETVVKGLKIRAMGANHWGKRWPPMGADYGFDSYVLEKDGVRVLLACDSAITDLFAAVAANPPEVAVFSIGAYDPWIRNHANPEQVWEMFKQTGARYLVPIHWGTFRLSKEPMDEPLKRLIAAAGDQSDRIVLREIGGTWTLPESERASAAAKPAPRAADASPR